MEWYQQKMMVILAAQSRSVVNALEFVSTDLKLPQFSDVAATVKFIRMIDDSDILNSQNRFAKEFKSVMKPEKKMLRPFLGEVKGYLIGLKLNGIPLHQSPRKTTVLGFSAAITSIISIYDEVVPTKYISYLSTYRPSEDHIELTFNIVRSRDRWNNNPTAC